MPPQSCDTVVALGNTTANGQTVFAKNSDRPANECQPLVLRKRQQHQPGVVTRTQFLALPEVDVTYRHIGSRPYWCWGYEHGFNEHQVVIGNEAVHSKLPEASEPKLVGMEILRLGLERGRSADEAVRVMTSLISQYGQGVFANEAGVRTYDNSYIVADPHTAIVIETAGHEWVVRQVSGTLGISNVYSVETEWAEHSPNAERVAVERGWWPANNGRFNFAEAYTAASRSEGSGAMRRARSCALLSQRRGGISARTMMAVLGDHGDGLTPDEPFISAIRASTGICRHPDHTGAGGCTAASLVADLCADGSRLPVYWCSLYTPCLGLFLPIFSEGELPALLTRGGATPSDDSPWWLFYRLNRAVMSAPNDLAPLVRQRWQAQQDELFATAYELAAHGRQLIDEGQRNEAARLLTAYMAGNAAQMMTLVTALVAELEVERVFA
jgi:secernin